MNNMLIGVITSTLSSYPPEVRCGATSGLQPNCFQRVAALTTYIYMVVIKLYIYIYVCTCHKAKWDFVSCQSCQQSWNKDRTFHNQTWAWKQQYWTMWTRISQKFSAGSSMLKFLFANNFLCTPERLWGSTSPSGNDAADLGNWGQHRMVSLLE